MIVAIKYQVFVSSTFLDLKEERRAVMEVILAMGHIPAGMELFSAGNQEQWELIRERIDECDYYIVIVAKRYGSKTDDDMSYTRKEYEYARKSGVPVAGFILHPDTAKAWPLDKCDPDNSELLERFVEFVQTLGTDYWVDAGDLKAKCAVALPELIKKNPRAGWVVGTQAVRPETVDELARLSSQNDELRQKVAELEDRLGDRFSTESIESLADEINAVMFNLRVRKHSWSDSGEEVGDVSLYDLLTAIAPSLLIEESEGELRERMTRSSPRAIELQEEEGWNPHMERGQAAEILGALKARDLIEPSDKPRSLRDHHRYSKLWTSA